VRGGNASVSATLVQATATGLEVRTEPLAGSAIVRDLLAGDARLSGFYAGHPLDPAAYARKLDEVGARLAVADRRAVAGAVRATTAAAAARWERIVRGDGVVVTTGQQAGLFGGPLYTIYKTLSAIRLAETLETALGIPVAPLFWVASDDHDWTEVDHTHVLDARNELHRIALGADPEAPPVPMSARMLGTEVEAAVAALAALLPTSEFAPAILDLVRSAYQPGRSMAAAFGALLAGLFSGFDLLLVDPSHPAVKRAASPVLERELTHAVAHTRLLAAQSERLRAAGYEPQVPISDDASNVFLHDAHGRERLVREAGSWLLRRTKRALADAELHALLAAEPERFSPNVLLRPVVESAIFPTICYVGGPSEVAYFAQIGCLCRAHGLEPPIVFPRFSVTLIEAKVRKVLDKFSMDAVEFRRPFHELATQRVRDEMPAAVTGPLERVRRALRGEYDALRDAAAAIDPTLRKWIEGVRNAALAESESAEKKVASHLKKKSEVELEQLRKAASNLFPESSPQERLLNVLPYIARYGSGLLPDVARAMQVQLIPDGVAAWTGVRCDG
jgi:bacillithiol biosynthesis cysteine-adding enzyme BshC